MEFKHIKEFNINVSTCGKVTRYNGHKFIFYKPQICRNGYYRVQFMYNGKRVSTSIHRLVAIAFLPNPLNKSDVNHIDGNKANNHFSNLEWMTRKENMKHAVKNKLLIHNEKEHTPYFKKALKELKANGWKREDLAKAFRVSETRITHALK